MQISKNLDSLRTCFCVVVKLSNVHEKYTKKETCWLKSNENHKFSFIKYRAMFIPSKENEPVPQQLPLFSNLKIIIPSLTTYAVCTLAVYCCIGDCCYDCNAKANHFFISFRMSSFFRGNFERPRNIHHYFFQRNKLQPARIHTFERLICFDLLTK